jgi:hypothetical protein
MTRRRRTGLEVVERSRLGVEGSRETQGRRPGFCRRGALRLAGTSDTSSAATLPLFDFKLGFTNSPSSFLKRSSLPVDHFKKLEGTTGDPKFRVLRRTPSQLVTWSTVQYTAISDSGVDPWVQHDHHHQHHRLDRRQFHSIHQYR